MMSFLDIYSNYSKKIWNHEDLLEILCSSKWGTYAYTYMPFVLINTCHIFKKIMNTTSKGLASKYIIIYMNDLMIFTQDRIDHASHLTKLCKKFWWFGISLNLKKCIFGFTKINLLGHIIYGKGITLTTKE